MTEPYTIHTNGPDATQQIGRQIGKLLQEKFEALGRRSGRRSDGPLIVLALNGDLGTGKTTLTQGIAAGLAIPQIVTSPTFTLVNEYETENGLRLIHMDSYRLGDPSAPIASVDDGIVMDAATFGLEEILETDDAVIVIEWAERLASILPPDILHIQLSSPPPFRPDGLPSPSSPLVERRGTEGEERRSLTFKATGPQSAELIEKLRSTNAT